ncbi:hypothetical protein LVJ94_06510 [Pendulispora rubella]|uniref:Uncharacterized protein n=1 Tax=Pendulispora rubella TaxID=2741070 RepID=A0ABZ2LAS4_9BACT
MRVLSLESSPLHEITYLAAASGGGTETRRLPVLRASVDALPADLDGLLLTSDLQGVAPLALEDGAVGLLGEVLAEDWRMFSETGALPSPGGVGVVLAGDLYSEPAANKRKLVAGGRCSTSMDGPFCSRAANESLHRVIQLGDCRSGRTRATMRYCHGRTAKHG